MDDQCKGCLILSLKKYIYIVVLLLEHWGSTGVTSCLFPEELRGSWVSSKKGDVLFTDQTLSSFYPCRHFEDCGDVTSNWTCTQNIGHKYVMMSDLITAESLKGRIFTCLYLYKMTSTKFLMYQGPTEEKGLPYYDYVKVALVPKNLTADQLCDLDESAFPPSRHNLLIRNDSLDSSKTTCPAELLGHYRELSCNTTVDVCSDRKQMIFDTKDCNLETFYFGNVTLLCLTSLSLGETTYVTVYRDDDNAEGYWNSSFLCMAVIINDTTVYIRHTPRDCRGLDTPAQDAADLVLETLDLCPIECSFSTSLFGSWVSNRKGDLLITNDTLTGFEPYGVECNATECSHLPTEFKCFLKSGTKYLIRSLRTSLSSNTVRIYVCMDFTKISKYKVIYHQAHSTKDPFLQDYLTYLNAAQSVDSIQDVCEFNATYDAALHSVLVSKEKMLEASEKCPEVFHSINRVDSVTCPYQMTSCDHETFIQITEDYCDTKSMYSESGQLSCIYDVASGSDHYLTLLNMDKAVDNNYTFLFTCIAYRLVNEKTWFLSDSPMACQPGQMTDKTQSLYNVSIIDSCPLAAEQTWIIALAVVIVAIVLATGLFLIVWFLCGGRDGCPGHRDKPSLTLTEAEKQFYGQKWSSAGSSRGGEGHYNISFEDVFSTQKDGRTQGQCYEGQRQRRSRRDFFGNDGEADTSELTEDTEGITHDGRSTAETQALEYEQFTQDLNELKCSGESSGLQRESTLISLPQDKTVGVLSDDGFHEDVDGEVDTSTENMDKNKIHATPQEHAQNHRKSRRKGDDQDMVNSETSEIDMSISQDVTWSAAKHRNVLGVSKNAGYIRKHRKYPGRTLLTSLSGQTLRHHAHGHNKTLVTGLHGLELQDTPFYSEYHDYTTLRSQMVRDGFWDDQNDYFSSLNRLNERDHSLSNIADIGVVQTSAKEQTSGADVTSCQTENKTNVASSRRITSKSIQALTDVNSEDNNMQLDEKQRENLQQFASEGKYEQAVNPPSQNHDLLSKLYSKLQDFDDLKDEEFGPGSQTYETKIPKDRREMSSALRRLLSTRLALESVGSEKYEFDLIKSSNYGGSPRSLNPFEDFISQKFALKFRSHLKRSSHVQTMASRKGTKNENIQPLPLQEASKKNAISDPTSQVDRGSFGWTYNLLKQPHFTPGLSTSASDRPAPQLKKWEMQDLNLRKLLEELYTEYKFMTRVIQSTTDSDKTEAEVCNKLEEGREYLLQRALFWLERSSSADSIESRSLAGRIHKQLDTLATTLQPDQHKKSGPS